MLRRDFLKKTGAAALASAAANGGRGPSVHASDKTGSSNPVIGKGEYRYECFHNWAHVPDSVRWYETHGVAIDKAGFVYIKHRVASQKPKSREDAATRLSYSTPRATSCDPSVRNTMAADTVSTSARKTARSFFIFRA